MENLQSPVEILKISCQVVIGFGILNVWILRSKRPTSYRSKQATSLKEEFAAYGLPSWFIYLVGAIKIPAALALLAGSRGISACCGCPGVRARARPC